MEARSPTLTWSLQPPPVMPSASACPMAKPTTYQSPVAVSLSSAPCTVSICEWYSKDRIHHVSTIRKSAARGGITLEFTQFLSVLPGCFCCLFLRCVWQVYLSGLHAWRALPATSSGYVHSWQYGSIPYPRCEQRMERNCSLIGISTWSKPIYLTTDVHLWRHSGSWEFAAKGTSYLPTSNFLPHWIACQSGSQWLRVSLSPAGSLYKI